MTFEELKAEAKRQGYRLIKIKKEGNIQLLPCSCGAKRPARWFTTGYENEVGEFYKCDKCGKRGKTGKNNSQAKINWNLAVEVEE